MHVIEHAFLYRAYRYISDNQDEELGRYTAKAKNECAGGNKNETQKQRDQRNQKPPLFANRVQCGFIHYIQRHIQCIMYFTYI